jgi:hypothetical protein
MFYSFHLQERLSNEQELKVMAQNCHRTINRLFVRFRFGNDSPSCRPKSTWPI